MTSGSVESASRVILSRPERRGRFKITDLNFGIVFNCLGTNFSIPSGALRRRFLAEFENFSVLDLVGDVYWSQSQNSHRFACRLGTCQS